MNTSALQQALVEHVQAIERLTGFVKGRIPDADAVAELQSFWNQTCRLRRHARDNRLPDSYRRMADALFVLSHELILVKKEEFACHSLYAKDDEGEDGAAAGVPRSPLSPIDMDRNVSPFPGNYTSDDEAGNAHS